MLTSACCLRSTTAGDRAVVTGRGPTRGSSDSTTSCPTPPSARTGGGSPTVSCTDSIPLPRADLLMDENLAGVFAHIQGRRTIPVRLHAG